MLRSQIKAFYNADYIYNTFKAKTELGFNPKPQRMVLKETFNYLKGQDMMTKTV